MLYGQNFHHVDYGGRYFILAGDQVLLSVIGDILSTLGSAGRSSARYPMVSCILEMTATL